MADPKPVPKKSKRNRVIIARNQVLGKLEVALAQGQAAENVANLADAVETLTSTLVLMGPKPEPKPGEPAPPPVPDEEEV
jgi:hypothetical protein